MPHLPELIQDLAVILVTAGAVTLLFQRLHQPVVLGYLVAGLLVGPHVPLIPDVIAVEHVKIWAEIGVIILLFTIGLDFSFRKLLHTGRSAAVTGVLEVVLMMALGYAAGQALGWTPMESLYLGGILSISSTTIIARALQELGQMRRSFVPLVLGILIVEDLIAILLMVIFTTFSISKTLDGATLLMSTLRLGFFLILWVVLGSLLVPRFLKRISRWLGDETVMIVGLGLCFMMVTVAAKAGFSAALGAFVMGSILSETSIGPRLEKLLVPVRDLFGAIFFVSMGMLVDPAVLMKNPGAILLIGALVIAGKTVSTALGAVMSGEPLTRSLKAGFSLAQIGEFSFIIAALGVNMGVIGDHVSAVAVAVSALTTFTTPYLIARANPWALKIESWLPDLWRRRLEIYRQNMIDRGAKAVHREVFRLVAGKVVVNSVLIVAIVSAGIFSFVPMMEPVLGTLAKPVCGLVTMVLTVPFFWGLTIGRLDLKGERPGRGVAFLAALVRVTVGVGLLIFMLGQFANATIASGLLLLAVLTAPLWGRTFARKTYQSFEQDLRGQFDGSAAGAAAGDERPVLAPWDASLVDFEVSQTSEVVGRTLMDSALKERFGVTVALIERAAQRILAPGRDTRIFPGDRLFLIGTDDQLADAGALLTGDTVPEGENVEFGLMSVPLKENSEFIGRPIRTSGLREKIDGLVVGIERAGERHLNPDSGLVLLKDDLLWVVGDLEKIRGI